MTVESQNHLTELVDSFNKSPESSFKVTNYFQIYKDLFSHLRGTNCTFVEVGVLHGGSLFMWRDWLGPHARIIGIDLNPAAKKWESHGFEIYIGDQGDPEFWKNTFNQIGNFDVVLDDGGHQSFQQIVTLSQAIAAAKNKCIVVVEDTCTSFMKQFSSHQNHSFLEYVKDATDNLVVNTAHFFPGEFPTVTNSVSPTLFENVYSIEFFSGIVAVKIDPSMIKKPELIYNRPVDANMEDFRYGGKDSAAVEWPTPFERNRVVVRGIPNKK